MIAFARDGTGICVYSFDTGLVYPVTHGVDDKAPSWSPCGLYIVFERENQVWVTDSIPDTAVEERSWGSIKAMYR